MGKKPGKTSHTNPVELQRKRERKRHQERNRELKRAQKDVADYYARTGEGQDVEKDLERLRKIDERDLTREERVMIKVLEGRIRAKRDMVMRGHDAGNGEKSRKAENGGDDEVATTASDSGESLEAVPITELGESGSESESLSTGTWKRRMSEDSSDAGDDHEACSRPPGKRHRLMAPESDQEKEEDSLRALLPELGDESDVSLPTSVPDGSPGPYSALHIPPETDSETERQGPGAAAVPAVAGPVYGSTYADTPCVPSAFAGLEPGTAFGNQLIAPMLPLVAPPSISTSGQPLTGYQDTGVMGPQLVPGPAAPLPLPHPMGMVTHPNFVPPFRNQVPISLPVVPHYHDSAAQLDLRSFQQFSEPNTRGYYQVVPDSWDKPPDPTPLEKLHPALRDAHFATVSAAPSSSSAPATTAPGSTPQNSPAELAGMITAAPKIRNFHKEATSIFVPSSVRARAKGGSNAARAAKTTRMIGPQLPPP